MKSRMCKNCIKYKTIYCPNSDECLSREDKPFYEDKYTILTKVEALDETLKDYIEELQTLKIKISAREEVCNRLENNWNKLKEYIKNEIPEDVFIDTEWFVSILDKMQELERGVSDVKD
nr:MAG TPA: hypothetical protein [Caudoviricetes sp.]